MTIQILLFYFSEKIRLDISCESSARQTIYMNCQALLSLKKKKQKNKTKKKLNSQSAYANCVDPDEMDKPSHQNLHCLPFYFRLKPLFAAVYMSKFKEGSTLESQGRKG